MAILKDYELLKVGPTYELFSFIDESNLAIDLKFENKDEVKNKLKDIALKAYFEMVITCF